ncbi:MAG: MmgE/PrpD family protein [Acidimicrobiia bacterium]|nr:MmgE/PrpD family protein [Acidimicrobiia bacterium]
MSLTKDLVERVGELDFGELSAGDLTATRTLLLDHLGVAANGAHTDSAAAMQRFTKASPVDEGSPVVGTRLRTEPLPAAMANAVAAHSIEYDDVHNAASSHPGVVVFPAALAAAEIAGVDAAEFLLGCVVGYEVMCRVGRAANPPAHYGRHFHPTGTTGHFGAAAAAASIFGLNTDETVSALGIAATMAAGSMEFLRDGAWTKRLHPAQAARNGVEAAQMAQQGFEGTKDGIGGDRGFLAGYSGHPNPKEVIAAWGDRTLEVQNTSIKAHTCCRYKQGPIDALLEMRAEHGVGPDDVAKITIGIPTVADDIIWSPVEAKRRPVTVVDAQFSMPYGAAVAVARGRASLEEYDGSLLSDSEIVRLMDLTECVIDTDLDLTYPVQWRAWAELETMDGTVHRAEIDDPKGDPTNPLSSQELRAKFDDLTSHCYTAPRRDALAMATATLGTGTSLADMVELLPADAS